MNIFKQLALIRKYGKEIDQLLEYERVQLQKEAYEATRYNLRLCLKHKQEADQSHYSEKNCDHCQVLAKLEAQP